MYSSPALLMGMALEGGGSELNIGGGIQCSKKTRRMEGKQHVNNDISQNHWQC